MPERALPSLRRKSVHLQPVSPAAPPPRGRFLIKKPETRRASREAVPAEADSSYLVHIPREGSNRSINEVIVPDDDIMDAFVTQPAAIDFAPRVPKELQLLQKIQGRVDSAMQSYDEAMSRPVIEYDSNPDEYMPVTWKVGEILMATHEAMTMISGFSERPFMHDLDEARVLMSRDANDVVNELAKECAPGMRRINAVYRQTIALLQDMKVSSSSVKHSAFSEDLHKMIDRLQKEKAILVGQLTETANMYTSVTESIHAKDDEVKTMAEVLQAKTDELAKLRQELFVRQAEDTKKQDQDKAAALWKDKYLALTKVNQALELREKDTAVQLDAALRERATAEEANRSTQQALDKAMNQSLLDQATIREQAHRILQLDERPHRHHEPTDTSAEYEFQIKQLKEKLLAVKEQLAQTQQDHKAALERQHMELRKHFELTRGEHGFVGKNEELDTASLFPTQPKVLVLKTPPCTPPTAQTELVLAGLDEGENDTINSLSAPSLAKPEDRRSSLTGRRRTALDNQKQHIESQVEGFINDVFVAPPPIVLSPAIPDIGSTSSDAADNMLQKPGAEAYQATIAELQMQLEMDKQLAKKRYTDAMLQYRDEMAARYEKKSADLIARHKLETQQMATALQSKYHSLLEEKEVLLTQAQTALRRFYKSIDAAPSGLDKESQKGALQYQRTLKAVAKWSYMLLGAQNEEAQRQHHDQIEQLCDEIKATSLESLLPPPVEVPVHIVVERVRTPELTREPEAVVLPEVPVPAPEVKPARTLMARSSSPERPMTPPPTIYAPPGMHNIHTQVSDRDWMDPKELEALDAAHTTLPHYVLEGASVFEKSFAPEDDLMALTRDGGHRDRMHWTIPALCLNQPVPPASHVRLTKERVQALVNGYASTLAEIKARINWNKWQCVLKCLGLKRMEDVLKLDMQTSHRIEDVLVRLRRRSVAKRAGFSDTHMRLRDEQKRAWDACMDTLVTYSAASSSPSTPRLIGPLSLFSYTW
ncbi:hypothetical protein ACHHYP_07252 [Achlya hypogyna]|uniref:Uncharacterized protein n=1 Tax=Achlya hypogyna TaxID=1202772 RepID=A0A1V9ZMC7_ACHHY|nr:hypothetical protein ACHHYP_07252 [Achlya hypogyna]